MMEIYIIPRENKRWEIESKENVLRNRI